jgi:hypothetical protein
MIQAAVPNNSGETPDEYDVSSFVRVYGSSAESWVLVWTSQSRWLDNCTAVAYGRR